MSLLIPEPCAATGARLVKIDHIAIWMGGSDKSYTAELIDAKKRNPGQGMHASDRCRNQRVIRSDANDPSATLSALARDQPAQSIAEERNRVRGFYLLPETDDIRGQTPNAESYQLFMMPEAAAALHRPLISYQAIFTVAHARESAIPEVVFDV